MSLIMNIFMVVILVLKFLGDMIISIIKFPFVSVFSLFKTVSVRKKDNLHHFKTRSIKKTKKRNVSVISLLIEAIRVFLGKEIKLKRKPRLKNQMVIYRKHPDFILTAIKKANRIKFNLYITKQKIFSIPKRIYFFLYLNLIFLKIKYFLIGALIIGSIFVLNSSAEFIRSLPNPKSLTELDTPTTSKIFDRNGTLLYEIYQERNRTPVTLSEVPKNIIDATIAIEDDSFYFHKGYSLRGIFRAIYHNLTQDTLEGGSTITQQLIRSAMLTPEKTITRKMEEIFLAVWAEAIYTKDEILEMYFNQVPYGGTAWGIEAAAQTYFGKSVKDLDLGESAFLAGLPAAPTRYSPYGSHPEFAKQRQEEVIKRMLDLGYISKSDAEKAISTPLNLKPPRISIAAPHFVMYVKSLLEQNFGSRVVDTGGLRVTTTLDLNIQQIAQKAVTDQVLSLRNLQVGNGAAMVVNPGSGEILAMVGSTDYFDNDHQGNVNVALSARQPGSSIKVVNYAAALTNGFTAATILNDTPVVFRSPSGYSYQPVNYDGRYHGTVTLRTALGSSYNIPAVKVLDRIGVKTMIDMGKAMGITTWNDESRYGLSLTLGGGEVTMLDMEKVYSTLANGGTRYELTPFLKITNYRGENLSIPTSSVSVKPISPEIAYILSSILADNGARTPAFGPNSALVIPGKTVSVKTGTSDSKRDNWTIGYTPDYVTAVWVGNNDNSPMNPQLTSGITGAAPIWNEIMSEILAGKPDKVIPIPEGIIIVPCNGRLEYFIRGTEPKGGCQSFRTATSLFSPTPNPSH